jgi:23S rRNA pseudouridine1911/1915/1917 synthase
MGVAENKPSLIAQAREYIKRKYRKPGNVYLGIISRLDTPVTGVVIMARTSKAAARLTEQFRSREVEKVYWALVGGIPPSAGEECVDWVRHDDRGHRMQIAAASHPDAKEARLSYHVIGQVRNAALLEINLYTGRKHQIRIQLAHRGWPILGDRKYGSTRPFPAGIALHSRFIAMQHPVRKTPLELTAPLPPSWPAELR